MSHHADPDPAPSSYRPPDLCDLYVFRGDVGTVLIQTTSTLRGPDGFRSGWRYAFHVADPDAGWHPELTYQLTFGYEHDGAQQVQLWRIDGPQAGDQDAGGRLVTSSITETLIEAGDGLRLWAGLAANPAWIHGGIQAAAEQCVADGTPFETLAALPAPGMNLLAYSSVNAIVLEIPGQLLGGERLGIWATAAVHGPQGWRQASRCAFPLLATLFGLNHGGTRPHEDHTRYGHVIRGGAARAAKALGTVSDPEAHGARVAQLLLPDVLPYQPGTEASFDVGTVNGRGLTDPAAEAVISLALGTHVPFGLDASSATGHLRAVFPYLGVPVEPTEPIMFLALRGPRARR